MLALNFIVTPLNTAACCTCAKWEGARILQDGCSHSWSEAIGYCHNADDGSEQHVWHLPKKIAPETACDAWDPTQEAKENI